MKNNKGEDVKKGSWTKEEDVLLTKCIQDFGEGRWNLVPFRAGLKRCRRSCRMRWLNHLRPNLKKGYFGKDEVDLLHRLHNLLGNRWALIAGRLPGRTGNDVKNFWNTHICKKPKIVLKTTPTITTTTTTTTTTMMSNIIIKPEPYNLTMSRSKIRFEPTTATNHGSPLSTSLRVDDRDELAQWWNDLLQMTENDNDDHHSPM